MKFRNFSLLHNDHQVPDGLVAKALRMIKSDAKKGAHLVDFGKVVDLSNLVEVSKDDECYEKVRSNRPYPSRFVKNRLPRRTYQYPEKNK
ncbi:MAG: hypothetical protein HDR88_13675 [Bacteroides sp.]|nr:hypothetical protein [Bacteroides sp.]